jgi:hypothetical protein
MKRLAAMFGSAMLVGGVSFLTSPVRAHAAVPNIFVISSLGDAPDANTADGACQTAGGDCTLRAAIQQADADPPGNGDEIDFGVPGTVTLGSALPDLGNSMFITGTTSRNTVRRGDGTGIYRIFNLTNNATVDIDNVNVTNGYVTDPLDNCGGGIQVSQGATLHFTGGSVTGNTTTGGGGGICTAGTTTITGSTVGLNFASAGIGGGIYTLHDTTVTDSTISSNEAGDGGGIMNVFGTLTLVRDTVRSNVSFGSSSVAFVGHHGGGGVYSVYGVVSIANSTIASNSASAALGGGILEALAAMTVVNSTIAGNSAGTGGGFDDAAFYSDTIRNTLIAANTATTASPDLATSGTSGGHNLVGDGTGAPGFVNGSNGDKVGTAQNPVDAKLDTDQGRPALKDNGGPTQTIAILAGSPAIDAGSDGVLGAPDDLTTDQRGSGHARKQGAHVDIGAYEKAPK